MTNQDKITTIIALAKELDTESLRALAGAMQSAAYQKEIETERKFKAMMTD